jgi:hypothetical protein
VAAGHKDGQMDELMDGPTKRQGAAMQGDGNQ